MRANPIGQWIYGHKNNSMINNSLWNIIFGSSVSSFFSSIAYQHVQTHTYGGMSPHSSQSRLDFVVFFFVWSAVVPIARDRTEQQQLFVNDNECDPFLCSEPQTWHISFFVVYFLLNKVIVLQLQWVHIACYRIHSINVTVGQTSYTAQPNNNRKQDPFHDGLFPASSISISFNLANDERWII